MSTRTPRASKYFERRRIIEIIPLIWIMNACSHPCTRSHSFLEQLQRGRELHDRRYDRAFSFALSQYHRHPLTRSFIDIRQNRNERHKNGQTRETWETLRLVLTRYLCIAGWRVSLSELLFPLVHQRPIDGTRPKIGHVGIAHQTFDCYIKERIVFPENRSMAGQ